MSAQIPVSGMKPIGGVSQSPMVVSGGQFGNSQQTLIQQDVSCLPPGFERLLAGKCSRHSFAAGEHWRYMLCPELAATAALRIERAQTLACCHRDALSIQRGHTARDNCCMCQWFKPLHLADPSQSHPRGSISTMRVDAGVVRMAWVRRTRSTSVTTRNFSATNTL